MSGLLAQMFAGGTERSAGGMAEKIRTDAKNSFAKRIQDDRIAAAENIEGVRAANNNATAALKNHYATERTNAQNEYNKGLLVDQRKHEKEVEESRRKHEKEVEESRRKWELENRAPKNELPANVKAKADFYKEQMKSYSGALEKAIELQDQPQIDKWTTAYNNSSKNYRNLIDGKSSLPPEAINSLIKSVKPGEEKAFLSQASSRYDSETLNLMASALSKNTPANPTESAPSRPVNNSPTQESGQSTPDNAGKHLPVEPSEATPSRPQEEPKPYIPRGKSTVPGMTNITPAGLLNSPEVLNKRAEAAFKATPRGEIVSEATEEARSIFSSSRRKSDGSIDATAFEARFNQLVADLELTNEEQDKVLRAIGAIR